MFNSLVGGWLKDSIFNFSHVNHLARSASKRFCDSFNFVSKSVTYFILTDRHPEPPCYVFRLQVVPLGGKISISAVELIQNVKSTAWVRCAFRAMFHFKHMLCAFCKFYYTCTLFFRWWIQDVNFGVLVLAQRQHQLVLGRTSVFIIAAVVERANVQGPKERNTSFTIVGVERYYQW